MSISISVCIYPRLYLYLYGYLDPGLHIISISNIMSMLRLTSASVYVYIYIHYMTHTHTQHTQHTTHSSVRGARTVVGVAPLKSVRVRPAKKRSGSQDSVSLRRSIESRLDVCRKPSKPWSRTTLASFGVEHGVVPTLTRRTRQPVALSKCVAAEDDMFFALGSEELGRSGLLWYSSDVLWPTHVH